MMNMMPGMPGSMPQQAGAAGGGMSLPQLLAMIQGSQGGGGSGMSVPPPGAATPMANYIGAPGGGAGMMQHPSMPGVAAPTQIGGMGAGAPAGPAGGMGGAGGSAGLMQLLAQLRGGQTGVQPGQGGVPGPNTPGNTQSALTMGPNGMWGGTPGQPPPMAQPGMQPGMQQPGMPPGGGVPQAMASGMSGQMSPQQMQWLHSIFGGAQVPPQPTPMMGGNG